MTHLDAPAHRFVCSDTSQPWTIYDGKPANRITTAQGATIGSVGLPAAASSVEVLSSTSPAVRGVPWLEGADPVFPDDLDAAEAAEGVRVEAGDVLFVRTGSEAARRKGPRPPSGIPALPPACLPWLRERDVAVIGADTSNDVMPAQHPAIGLPVHGVGMGAMGLWISITRSMRSLPPRALAWVAGSSGWSLLR